MLEFTFCMLIISLMIYSMMMIFRWVGVDLAERRVANEKSMLKGFGPGGYSTDTTGGTVFSQSPMVQMDTYFYKPIKMNAISDQF